MLKAVVSGGVSFRRCSNGVRAVIVGRCECGERGVRRGGRDANDERGNCPVS